MVARAPLRLGVASAFTWGALGLVGACAQILDVDPIPGSSLDAGNDATTREGGALDAGDARAEATPVDDGGASSCSSQGATRCAAAVIGVETCGSAGVWSAPVLCGDASPSCVAGHCECAPNATRCEGQRPEECTAPEGKPGWRPIQDAACPGTCTLTGCGATPASCTTAAGGLDGGLVRSDGGTFVGISDCFTQERGVESCCTSNEIPGGSFYLSYDGVSPNFTSKQRAATVSDFRLDRFEVTVARFRQFVDALGGTDAGWLPPVGSGKHTHLNGGQGLVNSGVEGVTTFETGWVASNDEPLTKSKVTTQVECGGAAYGTWTAEPGPGDNRPINCLTWPEAYAFCIWDGGFLPSEAEWNYAASGGSEQRVYPWSPAITAGTKGSGDNNITCGRANYVSAQQCQSEGPDRVASQSSPDGGDSKWLQADLAGNVFEWTLDMSSVTFETAPACTDCAFLGAGPDDGAATRVQRGGAFLSAAYALETSFRGESSEADGTYAVGVRCARPP